MTPFLCTLYGVRPDFLPPPPSYAEALNTSIRACVRARVEAVAAKYTDAMLEIGPCTARQLSEHLGLHVGTVRNWLANNRGLFVDLIEEDVTNPGIGSKWVPL